MTEAQWIETSDGPGDTFEEICTDLGIDTSGTVEGTQLRDAEEDRYYDDEADRYDGGI